jgi:catechol 2,3-dioxygenase-like lactoylglutathione lyase family enzyme
MSHILGIDHVAFAARDLEATCAFYDRLFGARTHLDYAPGGTSLVRQIALGGALLSIHQAGNGLDLVAKHPTVGGTDICLRWSGSVDSAAELLRQHGIPIVDGPSPRRTADGLAAHSVYFRDPDGNLLELMAADGPQPRS